MSWLMEAAGWQVARHCRGATAVLCGTGNNGGDGLAAARHLHRWGRLRSVSCTDRSRLSGPGLQEADALEAQGVEIGDEPDFDGCVLVLDAVLGTGITRAPDGKAAAWIEAANASRRRIVAVDVPSGLDATTGHAFSPCIRASTTVTLALPKAGLLLADGPAAAGEVWVADIGIPPGAYEAIGVDVPPGLFVMHDRFQLVDG